jgi:heavy metal sensor kinase
MKPFKLRTKLTLSYAAVVLMLLAVIGILFYRLIAIQLENAVKQELEERVGAIRGFLRFDQDPPRFVYDTADPEEAFFVKRATRYFQIYDAKSGALVERSQDIEALGFQYTAEEIKELLRGPDLTGIQTEQVNLLLHNDVMRLNDGRIYLLQVGVSLELRDNALDQFLHVVLWILPVGILMAIGTGWWMARHMLHPIEELSLAAKQISISRLDRRLPVRGTQDELDHLANTFNEVFARLDQAVIQLKDFTANISHELRTPLTVLRGEAEVALAKASGEEDYRRVLESQLEEFEKLSHLIHQMLTLARAEAGQIPLERQPVDLAELAASLVEQMEAVAANKGITLAAQSAGQMRVVGDPGWLERMLLNLIDNAVKFTGSGGRIEVRSFSQGGEAILEVRDNGAGMAPEELSRIFERFYRGDPSRSKELEGAGLGLSLVEWIIKAHGGRIHAESRPGEGSVFRIALPSAAD